jgi:cell division transport system permease protein
MKHLLARTFTNIKRSGWRSYAIVFMMTITFLILGVLLTVIYTSSNIAKFLIGNIEVIGFFKDGVSEEQILQVKRDVEGLDYVSSVRYVSKEEAMKSFLEENQDNPDVVASVTTNPFPAHLNVKVLTLDKSEAASSFLKEKTDLIESVDDSKDFLVALNNIVLGIQIVGLILLVVFTLSTFFVIILAIGLSIYTYRNELIIMKLVGATNWYVRAPYVMQSFIFSFISILIASLIWGPVVATQYNKVMSQVTGGMEISNITINTILLGILIEFIFGFILALFSSYLATRRYIRY